MSQNSDNRRRAFADVVTVDAWHDDFANGRSEVELHADVVFGTGRVGGEIDSPVRFRMSVKRAEVVVVIPDLEPVSVDPKSVSRDSPEFQGELTETFQASKKASLKGAASASLSLKGGNFSVSTEAAGQASVSAESKIELSSAIKLMTVTQSKSPEGYYRWLIESGLSSVLEGRPWNAVSNPRLRLIDERNDKSKGIPPTVRVEVRCRREDIEITDLQIKNESLWESVSQRVGFQNRMAAAVSYIRNRLMDEGLEVNNIEDIFGHLTLGSTTARPT